MLDVRIFLTQIAICAKGQTIASKQRTAKRGNNMSFFIGLIVGIAFNVIASRLIRREMEKRQKIFALIVLYITAIVLIFLITVAIPIVLEGTTQNLSSEIADMVKANSGK